MDARPAEESAPALHLKLRRLGGYLLLMGLVMIVLLSAVVWRLFAKPGVESTPLTIFQRAIEDAAQTRSEVVSYRLQAVSASNPSLVWREHEGRRWVKVVSWMNDHAFDTYFAHLVGSPQGGITPVDKPVIWVTLAPEIQSFCRQLEVADPSFRLKQRLGLDPNRLYQRFAELWVQPEDLFRPCPDPETDDNRCELDFHPANPPQVKNIPDYVAYFNGLFATLYRPDGAPWTRLGYTYDWAYARRGIGASEFVVAPAARFLVDQGYPTARYCGGEPLESAAAPAQLSAPLSTPHPAASRVNPTSGWPILR